jgi:hypothetical protein
MPIEDMVGFSQTKTTKGEGKMTHLKFGLVLSVLLFQVGCDASSEMTDENLGAASKSSSVSEANALVAAKIASGAAMGLEGQSTSGPVPPQAVIERDMAKRAVSRAVGNAAVPGGVVIDDVPFYLWRHGCGPTAVGMVMGYYDEQGFDLIDGDADTQTEAVNQAIASGGDIGSPYPAGSEQHFENFAMPIDSGDAIIEDAAITDGRFTVDNSIADFMFTSRSDLSNAYGWSWTDHVITGFVAYVYQRTGWGVLLVTTHYYPSISWEVVKTEIDNNRPLVFLVDTEGDNKTDHFVTVVGYREIGGVREYACHDTWSTDIRWEAFQYMAPGQPWGIYDGSAFSVSDEDPCVSDADCDDGIACTIDTCDLITGLCSGMPNDALCDNGAFCDGEETCAAGFGCQTGTAPCADGEECDETVDECIDTCVDTVYEAETMIHSTGNAYPGGWNLYNNGYVAFNHTFNGGVQAMTVRAAGSPANGVRPTMRVNVNGAPVYTTTVGSSSFADYSFTFAAPVGNKEVRIYFTNDYYGGPSNDRNLYVDKAVVNCTPSIPSIPINLGPVNTQTNFTANGAQDLVIDQLTFPGWTPTKIVVGIGHTDAQNLSGITVSVSGGAPTSLLGDWQQITIPFTGQSVINVTVTSATSRALRTQWWVQ